MTVKEYNKLYMHLDTCKCVLLNLDKILEDKDIERLCSLVPDDFTEIMTKALELYVQDAKSKIEY